MRTQNPIRKIFAPANIIAALFILMVITGISHHEMWLDELHHWLLARDSATLNELFYNARYDVHPLLWDILLFILTRFTHNPYWMQVLNLLISIVAAILVLKHAPFPWITRALIIFGYFFFYEYTLISRNYSLGIMMLVLCCILYKNRKDHYLLLSFAMGILANTHLFALFVSLAFFLALIVDYFIYPAPTKRQKRSAIFSLAVYLLCLFLALIQIIPAHDSFLTVPVINISWQHLSDTLAIMTRAFFPIPQPGLTNWWNTNFFLAHVTIPYNLIPIIILITPGFILIRKPAAMIIFYFSTLSTLIFIFIFQVSAVRYYGFIYFSFISSLWIAEYHKAKSPAAVNANSGSLSKIITQGFIYGMLIIQLIAGSAAWILDFQKPFSQACNTVDYLVKNQLINKPVIVANCDTGVPVSAYLNQKVFYVQNNAWGSFCKWNMPYERVTADTILARIVRFSPEPGHELIVILNDSLLSNHISLGNDSREKPLPLEIRFLNKFTGSTVRSENYFIYQGTLKK